MSRFFPIFASALIALSTLFASDIASASVLKKHLTLSNCADNQICVARIQWDYSQDGGAIDTFDVATAGQGIVIQNFWVKTLTTLTSAGVPVLTAGVTGQETRFLPGNGIGQFTATSPVLFPPLIEGTPNVLGVPYPLPAADKIRFAITIAALTAGKVEFVIQYFKP
jgi:hypothetical protein